MQRRLSCRLEWLLWLVALSSMATIAYGYSAALQAGREAKVVAPEEAARQDARNAAGDGRAGEDKASAGGDAAGEVIGRVEIPALGLNVPITSGVETTSLLRGVGHVNGTAYPGGLGTVGLAGHRDTYLRPLEGAAVGMDIKLIDKQGTFHYHLDSWEIVTPEQVEVLLIRSRPELALITCYPFHYVGAAPKRFVIHAHLVSVAAE